MTSIKATEIFTADLKPSKILQRLFIVCHFLAIVAGAANALPFSIRLMIIAIIIMHFTIAFKQLTSERRRLRYQETSGWQLAEADNFESITLQNSTVLTARIIFLHIANKTPIVITYDTLEEEVFRQLLVKIKITLTIAERH